MGIFCSVGAGVTPPSITRMSVDDGELRVGVQLLAVIQSAEPVLFQVYVAAQAVAQEKTIERARAAPVAMRPGRVE
jgi:molybdopterin-binding protein